MAQLMIAALVSGQALVCLPTASADDSDAAQNPAIQVNAVPESDSAAAPAVAACGAFASALDGSASYYGEFADAIEGGTPYSDPAVQSTNETGRTALRQAAGVAMDAAGTPGLDPAIGDPMRAWSADATKMLLKMALHIPGDSLNTTAAEMNSDATHAQQACAAAGTHA